MYTKIKIAAICFLTLNSQLLFSQSINSYYITGANEYHEWNYQDFVDHNFNEVEAYSYKVKKNGKVTNKSTLIYRQIFIRDSNKVYGINCNTVFQSHGPAFLSWYNFDTYYSNTGKVLKHTTSPASTLFEKKYGSISYEHNTNEMLYEYNSKNLPIKETRKEIENHYSISKYTKDTFHLQSIQAKISEYVYDEKGNETHKYYTEDSTYYMPTESYKPDSSSVNCFYCEPRHLSGKKEYYENGKLKLWIWFTRLSEIHSKKYFYYDSEKRLIKQVDSTGWYFHTIPPYWESTTDIQYLGNGKIVRTTYNTEDQFGGPYKKMVRVYDSSNKLTSECRYTDTTQSCSFKTYSYIGNLINSCVVATPNGNKQTTIFTYNEGNLLSEERHVFNNKTTSVTKYIYK